jgi:hypothetical protein
LLGNLHFRMTFRALLARLVIQARSWSDSYEATLVLPAIICIAAFRMRELHLVGHLAVFIVFVAVSLGAGAWMGVCLGLGGVFRAVMRGLWAGAIEGAALPAFLNDQLDRHQALTLAGQIIYASAWFYWIGHMALSSFCDSLIQSQRQPEAAVSARSDAATWLSQVFRLTLRKSSLDEVRPNIAIAVRIVRGFYLIVLVTIAAWLLGLSPYHAFRSWVQELTGGSIR